MAAKYALIIGNTEYIDPGLAQLTAPGKDAEDFARVLKDKEIGAFDDIKVLLNQPEYVVRRGIDVFFDQKKPDDLLILYFSGHGVRDELGALYLAVKNTIRSRLRSTAVKSDYIREAMDQSRSKRQVLILDCCNSGAFEHGTKAATGVSIGIASAFEAGYGRIILTASDATQFAWEGDKVIGETDNSLFTHFLVKGLEGEADSDGDGRITVDELYDYAYEKVRFATPKQTPSKFSTKQQGEIVLRQSTRIEDIKPMPLPAELIDEIEDTRPYVREAAVQKLEKILKGKNIGMARSAREALEKIAADGNTTRHVAQTAVQVLESISQTEQKKERELTEPVTELKTDETRLARERVEAIRLAREKERLERQSNVIHPLARAIEKKSLKQQTQRRSAPKVISIIVGITFILLLFIGGGWAILSYIYHPTQTTSPPLITERPSAGTPFTTTIPPTNIATEAATDVTTSTSILTLTSTETLTPFPSQTPTSTENLHADPFKQSCINNSMWTAMENQNISTAGNCLSLKSYGVYANDNSLIISTSGSAQDIRQGIYTAVTSGTQISLKLTISTIFTPYDNNLANISVGIVPANSIENIESNTLLIYQQESPKAGYPIYMKMKERGGFSAYLPYGGGYRTYITDTIQEILLDLSDTNQLTIFVDGSQVIQIALPSQDLAFWIGYRLPENGQLNAEISGLKIQGK